MTNRTRIATLVTAAAALLGTGVARGDGPPAAHPPRTGWHVGFGVGGGQMSCESNDTTVSICDSTIDEAGGFDAHVGKMLSPRLSLQGEIWIMAHSEDRVTISHTISTVGAQYWLFPRIWVKGGVGGAVARASYKGPLVQINDRTDTVLGIALGAGWELVVGKRFALDLQLKYGTGFYADDQVRAHNGSLTVGFNWY